MPSQFFRHCQTEVITHSSLKEELLFENAELYFRAVSETASSCVRQSWKSPLTGVKKWSLLLQLSPSRAALRKKRNLKNKHIQTEQWECSEVIKACEVQPHTKEKLVRVNFNGAKNFKETSASSLQNYSYCTQNTFGLSQIYVHRWFTVPSKVIISILMLIKGKKKEI